MEGIKDFQLGEKNTSTLIWNKNQNRWLCGDNTNSILVVTKDMDSQLFFKNEILLENNNDDMNVNAIAINPLPNSNQCIIAHSEKIASYIFDEEDKLRLNTLLYKSFLPFTHIQYDHEGVLLFVASKDPDLVIFDVEQKQLIRKIITNDIGIRTFSLSPDSKYTAIVNMNGSVYINILEYGYNSDLKRTIKSTDSVSHHSSIINIEVTREPIHTGCKIAWYPNVEKKRLLAIPSDQGSIIFLTPTDNSSNHDNTKTMVSNWNESFLMSINNFTHESNTLNIVAFNNNGEYLVSSDMTGKIIVWAFDFNTPNNSIPLNGLIVNNLPTSSIGTSIQDLVWDCCFTIDNSAYNVLALAQNSLITFHNVLPSSHVHSKISNEVTNVVLNTSPDNVQECTEDDDNIYADDDDNFDENDEKTNQNQDTQVSLQTSQFSQIMQTNSTQQIMQVTEQLKETITSISNNTSVSTMKRLSKKSIDNNKSDDDDNDDDINFINEDTAKPSTISNLNDQDTINVHEIKRTSNPTRLLQVHNDDDDDDPAYADENDDFDDDEVVAVHDVPPSMVIPTNGQVNMLQRTMQAPFQPSSTKYDDKDRRYLVWNSIGSIILRRENLDNRIEFRFTNTGGSNRNETIIDRVGYVMGSLSYEGAVFASEPDDYDEQQQQFDSEFKKNTFGSTIYYHAFPGQRQLQGVNESFQYTLPAGEAVLAIAVGLGWIAIATSRNLLYIYSSVGHLCFTTSIPGVVVTMTGFNFHLGIIYQSHSLQADVYEITWDKGCSIKQLAANIPLPLPSPKHIHDYEINKKKSIPYNEQSLILDWVGFDVDNLLLTILDNQGMCWSLIKVAGWQWLPVFDTFTIRKDINYLCWPVMVKQEKLVYVQLNGESMPTIHPQPVVYAKPLKIPFPTMKDSKELGEAEKDQVAIKLLNQALSTHCESELSDLTSATNGFPDEQSKMLEEKIAKLQAQADKSVLEALQIACQKQLIPLALSLAMQIRTDRALRSAIKLANHFGRTVVANLLANILADKEEIAAQIEQRQYMNNNLHPLEYHSNPNDSDGYDAGNNYDGIATSEYYSDKMNPSKVKVPSVFSQALKSKSVVSPAVNVDHMNKPPRNPFLKTTSNNTSENILMKRKNVYDGIQDMKASPSPKKMPSLNRQTSFSQQARMQQLSSKRIL